MRTEADKNRDWPEMERRGAERDVGRPDGPTRNDRGAGAPAPPQRRRRLRDRLEGDDQGQMVVNPALLSLEELRNPLLLCDDDLRQTAKALGDIEGFLLAALRMLEKPDLTRADLAPLLQEDLGGRIDHLSDALGSLRKSLRAIADKVS